MSNWDTIPICQAQLAWLAMDRGEWQEAADRLKITRTGGRTTATRESGWVSA